MYSYQKYFSSRLEKLVSFDKIRMHKILQTVQYTILYLLMTWVVGTAIDNLFPSLDKEKELYLTVIEVCLQAAISMVLIFYIRKLVKTVPYIFSYDTNYLPYHKDYRIDEFNGNVIIPLVLVTVQSNFINKMSFLGKKLRQYLAKLGTSDKSGDGNTEPEKKQQQHEQQAQKAAINNTTLQPVSPSATAQGVGVSSVTNPVCPGGNCGGANPDFAFQASNSNVNSGALDYSSFGGGDAFGTPFAENTPVGSSRYTSFNPTAYTTPSYNNQYTGQAGQMPPIQPQQNFGPPPPTNTLPQAANSMSPGPLMNSPVGSSPIAANNFPTDYNNVLGLYQ